MCSSTRDRSPFLPQKAENSILNKIGAPSLSHKEVQKHSSGAAMEASWYEELRHFLLFLCHVSFCSEGPSWPIIALEPQPVYSIPGCKRRDTPPSQTCTFSSRTHRFHWHPIGQFIPDGVSLAKIRGSITKEEKIGGSLMVSTTLSEMSFVFNQKAQLNDLGRFLGGVGGMGNSSLY